MNILFYRYGSICEPDVIESFEKLQIEVHTIEIEVTDKSISPGRRIAVLQEALEKQAYLFVFTINFFPSIADLCHILQIPYVCWTVDSPVLELFSNSIKHNTNRIFLFDKAQYEYFSPANPDCIFYLPLATNVTRWDAVTADISAADRARFSSEISFVGSLYSEKKQQNFMEALPDYAKGYLTGIMEAQMSVYGYNFIEETLPASIIDAMKQSNPDFYSPKDTFAQTDAYTAANMYVGMKLAELQRTRTLASLSKHFQVNLFTHSDTSTLPEVTNKGGVKTLTEMPKVFHLSQINLNMTIPSIQTGLSLRVFDVMGCGGFLLTNLQAELFDYFTVGEDLEAYSSQEELLEKARFYLEHEQLRHRIALKGYEAVKAHHTYDCRILEIIKIISQTM